MFLRQWIENEFQIPGCPEFGGQSWFSLPEVDGCSPQGSPARAWLGFRSTLHTFGEFRQHWLPAIASLQGHSQGGLCTEALIQVERDHSEPGGRGVFWQ